MRIPKGTKADDLKKLLYNGNSKDITLKYIKGNDIVEEEIKKTKLFAVVKNMNKVILVQDVYVDSSSDEDESSSDEDISNNKDTGDSNLYEPLRL